MHISGRQHQYQPSSDASCRCEPHTTELPAQEEKYNIIMTNNICDEDNNMGMGGWPSSVNLFHHDEDDDSSVPSEITFQSAVRNISMDRLMQLLQPRMRQEQSMSMHQNEDICLDWSGARVASSTCYPRRAGAADHHPNHQEERSNTNRLPGMPTRRFTEPPASSHSQSSSDYINTIVELKLQVANQKETIDRLTSDLNHALSGKKALLTQTKRPKPLFTMRPLAEEKDHSDNSRSLHQQYNALREDMKRMQKSMDLQQETVAALKADNRRLSEERSSLQRQIDRMSCKLTESSHSLSSSDPHLHDAPFGSQDVTASLTDVSGLSELISPADLAHTCYQPRRATGVDQRQDELAHTSYLPFSKVKRRFSEPVNSHGQKFSSTPKHDVELSASRNENKNGWFIGDESESSFLSKTTYEREGIKVAEEKNVQVLHRRSSMPDKLAPTTTASSPSPQSRRSSCLNVSKRNERCSSYSQSEETTFNFIDWGDCDSNDDAET